MAVLLDGQSTQKLITTTNKVLESVLDQYATSIQKFDGNLSLLPTQEIQELLTPLFWLNQHDDHQTAEQPLSKWPLAVIALLLLTLGGWWYYVQYQKEQFVAMISERIHTNPHLALYAITTSWQDSDTLAIKGRVPSQKLKDEITTTLMSKKFPYALENRVLVSEPLKDYAKSKRLIAKQVALLNANLQTNLTCDVTNGIVTISGETALAQQLKHAIDLIAQFDAIKHVYSNVTLLQKNNDRLYFRSGMSAIAPRHAPLLEHIAAQLQQYPHAQLSVIGYASPSKNIVSNTLLSKQRAQNATAALIALGVSPQRIRTQWINQVPLFSDTNSSKSQCVKFYWYNMSK
ncbi:MAG: hypothetical protein DSZ03_05125 [Sulfurimonas sp.]|nr:MAG: hypothetical protein DSZ03_05125 [Sulfurimonas sp.]